MVRIMQVWLKRYDAPVEFTAWDDGDGMHRIATGCPSGFKEEILLMHPDPPQVGEGLYVRSRRTNAPEGQWWEGMWGTVERIEVLDSDPTVPAVESDPDPLELIHETYPS